MFCSRNVSAYSEMLSRSILAYLMLSRSILTYLRVVILCIQRVSLHLIRLIYLTYIYYIWLGKKVENILIRCTPRESHNAIFIVSTALSRTYAIAVPWICADEEIWIWRCLRVMWQVWPCWAIIVFGNTLHCHVCSTWIPLVGVRAFCSFVIGWSRSVGHFPKLLHNTFSYDVPENHVQNEQIKITSRFLLDNM